MPPSAAQVVDDLAPPLPTLCIASLGGAHLGRGVFGQFAQVTVHELVVANEQSDAIAAGAVAWAAAKWNVSLPPPPMACAAGWSGPACLLRDVRWWLDASSDSLLGDVSIERWDNDAGPGAFAPNATAPTWGVPDGYFGVSFANGTSLVNTDLEGDTRTPPLGNATLFVWVGELPSAAPYYGTLMALGNVSLTVSNSTITPVVLSLDASATSTALSVSPPDGPYRPRTILALNVVGSVAQLYVDGMLVVVTPISWMGGASVTALSPAVSPCNCVAHEIVVAAAADVATLTSLFALLADKWGVPLSSPTPTPSVSPSPSASASGSGSPSPSASPSNCQTTYADGALDGILYHFNANATSTLVLDESDAVLQVINAACGDVFMPPNVTGASPVMAPLLDERMDAWPALDFGVAPSALLNTAAWPTPFGSTTFVLWVGTVLSNSTAPPLACLFSGLTAGADAPSFELSTVGLATLPCGGEEICSHTGIGPSDPMPNPSLLWLDGAFSNETLTYNATLPADGRVILAANHIDGVSVDVWFQGAKVLTTSTTDVLEGGYLASLGALLRPNGTLDSFCGCALHELVVASPKLLTDDAIETAFAFAAAAWSIDLGKAITP